MIWVRFGIIVMIALVFPAHVQSTVLCSDAGLDAAIAAASPGSTVTLDCPASVKISSTKVISVNLSIEGAGSSVTLVGDASTSTFKVMAGANMTIDHLTLRQGGIENHGTLTITSSRLEGSENGLINFGVARIEHSVFAGNLRAAIFNAYRLTVLGSLFTANRHGLDNASGDAVIVNSTFYGNMALIPHEIGAGIANSGTVQVINSTFADNVAFGGGGAIGNHGAGVVKLTNTILTGKWPCYGLFLDGEHNLQYPAETCGSSIPTVDPKLLPLADNGGPTETVALQPGSPAIGAGDESVCAGSLVGGVDARDQFRDQCDIGAFAYNTRLLMPVGLPNE